MSGGGGGEGRGGGGGGREGGGRLFKHGTSERTAIQLGISLLINRNTKQAFKTIRLKNN